MPRGAALTAGVVTSVLVLVLIWKTNLDIVNSFENNQRAGRKGAKLGTPLAPSETKAYSVALKAVRSSFETRLAEKVYMNNEKLSTEKSSALHGGQQPAEANKPTTTVTADKFHLVFSTGCTTYQDWQSYVFFYFAMVSEQTGDVTRVASGCKPQEAVILQEQFDSQIESMSPRFHLHITSDYSCIGDNRKPYTFFNKPMGLRHWMENGLGMPQNTQHNDTIFVILDPDQIILRPFVADYTHEQEVFRPSALNFTKIARGQPMAAGYAFGSRWKAQIDIRGILPNSTGPPSPVETWTERDVAENYVVGPPYVAVGVDMYTIVKTWAEFVVPVYKQTDGAFLAEMFAYSVAARHLNLPHRISQTFMISDPTVGMESAWKTWIDGKESQQVCAQDFQPMPHVFHFCQRYFLGPFFFGKRKLPKGKEGVFFSCEHPLMEEPPTNIADLYKSSVTPDGEEHDLTVHSGRIIRMAFALCQIIPRINQAAIYFKQQHCDVNTANLNKTFLFPKDKKRNQ